MSDLSHIPARLLSITDSKYTYRLLLAAIDYHYYNRYYQLLSIAIRDYSVPVKNRAQVNYGGPPCDGQVASNDIITLTMEIHEIG